MNSVLFAVYSFLLFFSSSPWAAVPHRWPSGLIEKNPKKKERKRRVGMFARDEGCRKNKVQQKGVELLIKRREGDGFSGHR